MASVRVIVYVSAYSAILKTVYFALLALVQSLKSSSRIGPDDQHSMRACPKLGFSADQEMIMACAWLDYKS